MHPLEWTRRNAEGLVEGEIGRVERRRRLVEEAEIGSFHVEAERRDRPFLLGEMGEDRGQQPFDRARLGRESGDPGDREMCGLGAEQEVGVEVHGGVGPARVIEPNGNPRVRPVPEVGVHAERAGDIRIVGEKDLPHADRLQRLLRDLAQHRRGVQPDLGPGFRRRTRVREIVERRFEIRVAQPFDHHAIHRRHVPVDRMRSHHSHDRADPNVRIERRPKVKRMRGVGSSLGGDDAS